MSKDISLSNGYFDIWLALKTKYLHFQAINGNFQSFVLDLRW